MLMGCRAPLTKEAQAWQRICRYAPHQGGELPREELLAMPQANVWHRVGAELDAYCATR